MELTEDDYYPVVPEQYRWKNWAEDAEGATGDALLAHIDAMFKGLRRLDISDDAKKRKWLIRSIMDGVNNFMKSGTLLRQVINKINYQHQSPVFPERHSHKGGMVLSSGNAPRLQAFFQNPPHAGRAFPAGAGMVAK